MEENFRLALLAVREQNVKLDEVSGRLSTRVDSMSTEMSSLSSEMSSLSSEMSSLSSEMSAGFKEIRITGEKTESALKNAFDAVQIVAAGMAELRREMSSFESRLERLEKKAG